ncbi:hypothetical protein OAT18_02375 [Tenacibaculum sp.]|nr:hypothetical protein [Tenacibaculum sp.]
MKKSILNLGKALNKAEQQIINGGGKGGCRKDSECSKNYCCVDRRCIVGPFQETCSGVEL